MLDWITEPSTDLTAQTETLKKSIFSRYISIKTEADEDLDFETNLKKKLSLNLHGHSRIKTENSSSTLLAEQRSVLSRRLKIPRKLNIIKLNRRKTETSKNSRKNSFLNIKDLVKDPFINGRINNDREAFFKKATTKSARQVALYRFIQSNQLTFIENCSLRQYSKAEEAIIKILNYAIDLNLIDLLCLSLKILGEFHLSCRQMDQAFYYFNQTRRCAMMIGNDRLVVLALIKQSMCASQVTLYEEAISYLKKALEYAWFFNQLSLQLSIYDEFGKVFYKMGDIEKAKNYHHKFFSCGYQSRSSAILLLSKESLILEGMKKRKIIRQITTVFLLMIKVPIKNCQTIEQFRPELGFSPSLRNSFESQRKYQNQFKPVKAAIIQTLEDNFFKNMIGEVNFNNEKDWTIPNRARKFLSYDIQRNNYLMEKGISFSNYNPHRPKVQIKIKEIPQNKSLPKIENSDKLRVTQKLNQWYSSIKANAIQKSKNKNIGNINRVQIRDLGKTADPTLANLRIIYHEFFLPENPKKDQ